jgi:hypothetical protein
MTLPVNRREFVDEMAIFSDDLHAYINRFTGEFVGFDDEIANILEAEEEIDDLPDWQQAMVREADKALSSPDYLELPTKFEIVEYGIMVDFCDSLENPKLQDELRYAIRGSGAFRRFKDTIYRHAIEDQWYAFRFNALAAIAIRWLEEHDIPYTMSDK